MTISLLSDEQNNQTFYAVLNLFRIENILKLVFLSAGFSQIKLGQFRIVDFILIILFMSLLVNRYFTFNKILIFFFFSILYAFIFGGISQPLKFFSEIFTFFLLFSLINLFENQNEDMFLRYLRYYNISMLISNLLVLIILFGFPEFHDTIVDLSKNGFRLKGFFSQTNAYALILIINIPIALYIFRIEKTLVNAISAIISIIALILTQSRGAFVGLVIAYIVTYLYYLIRKDSFIRLGKLLVLIISLYFVFISFSAIFPKFIEERFNLNMSRVNPLGNADSERRITDIDFSDWKKDRLYLITAAFNTLGKYPLGLGYQAQHEIIGKTTGIYLIPHNYFVNLLLTYGVFLGLIWNGIFLFLLLKGFLYLKQDTIRSDSIFFTLHIIIVAITFFYFTHSSEWIFIYIFLAIYCSYFRPNLEESSF